MQNGVSAFHGRRVCTQAVPYLVADISKYRGSCGESRSPAVSPRAPVVKVGLRMLHLQHYLL